MRIQEVLNRTMREYERIANIPLEVLIQDFEQEIINVYNIIENSRNPILQIPLKQTLAGIVTALRTFVQPYKQFLKYMEKEGIAAKLLNISRENNKSGEIKW